MADAIPAPSTEEAAAQIEAAYAAAPNHYRELAEEMIRSGEVSETTTVADAWAALEKHNSVQQ